MQKAETAYQATIGTPAKRHSNGISLAARKWHVLICLLGEEAVLSGMSEIVHNYKWHMQ